jgi:acetolactate synthase-1/2/3 large subunit
MLGAGRAVVEALKAEGVDRVYCLPGSHVLEIYDALAECPSIRLVTCKLESSISLMADIHGRLTGEPGVCLVTAGPGAANSLPGVAQAYAAASPLVHISGAVPLDGAREAFHGADDPDFTLRMFREVTKWSVRVEAIEAIPDILARAFQTARNGRPGPVHIEIPRETNTSRYLISARPAPVPAYRRLGETARAPAPDDVLRVMERLGRARRPVIAAGKGVLRNQACEPLAALAERLAAPVIFPQDAIGVIRDDHPWAAGFFALWSLSPFFASLLQDADLLLSVGLRAGTATSRLLAGHAPAEHIFVDFGDEGMPHPAASLILVADPGPFLRALLAAPGLRQRDDPERRAGLAALRRAYREGMEGIVARHRGARPIHPGVAVRALIELLEDDAVVLSDVGNCAIWLRNLLPVRHPNAHLQSGMWNAMGLALPSAIAAKLALPRRQVVGVAGDGALLMSLGEFGTALEQETGIVLLVLNDGAYGMIQRLQVRAFGRTLGCQFRSPDFAAVAREFGWLGLRVEDPADLGPALRKALEAGLPAVLDVLTGDYPYPDFELSGG